MIWFLSITIVILLVVVAFLWETNRDLQQRLCQEVESYHHERQQKVKLQKERDEWNKLKERHMQNRPPGW